MNELWQLKMSIRRFAEEREWQQFHTPKDLAIGIVTEAAELLELHRFKANDFEPDAAADELADVMIFAIRYADVCGVDIYAAVTDKLLKNSERYPVETSRGSNRKYNE